MVSQITLGNAYQSNGKTVLGGSQSGIDTKSLIDALVTAKSQPATVLTETNKKLDGQMKAMTSLKSILATFQSATDVLRNQPGVNNASKTVFNYRTAAVTTNDGLAASNFANVTVQPGAQIQDFTINSITQLAQQTKQHTGIFTLADTTSAAAVSSTPSGTQFGAGTFTLHPIDGGADVSITLNHGDSLQAVANQFNQVKNRTGIQAGIIQVASGQYKLVFTGTQTGAAYGFDFRTGGTTITSDPSGVFANIKAGVTNQQSAQNAMLNIDGVDIVRSTNAIDDIYTGVTFNLTGSTILTATKVNVSVVPDTSIASNAITSFVDAYNSFKLFASAQNQRNADGTPTEDAVLANDPTLRSIVSQVNDQVTAVVNGITSGDPERLQDVGISFDDFAGDDNNPETKNIMTIDTDALSSALTANFQGVANLFEYNLTSDNTSLTTYARTKNLDVTAMTLSLDRTNGVYTATYTDSNNQSQVVSLTAAPIGSSTSLTLSAPAGSGLEGLTLIYTSTADATIHATITQGIGDTIYNALTGMIDSTNGTLTKAMETITNQENRNTTEITKINDQMVTYRERLTQQYANLEAALTKANQLLQLLQAQADARLAAAGG